MHADKAFVTSLWDSPLGFNSGFPTFFVIHSRGVDPPPLKWSEQGLLTLQRKRTGGNQQVTVKHIHQQVNVTQGGQAVVAGDKVTSLGSSLIFDHPPPSLRRSRS